METTLIRLLNMDLNRARQDRTFPPGTIGVLSTDLARYASFCAALLAVKYPYDTTIDWRRGCDIVSSCNKLVQDLRGDWLWIMGDDHAFDQNILFRLLGHMYQDGYDLVAPLVMARQAPFPTVIGVINEIEKRVDSVPLEQVSGVQKVDVVGSAGLLVRRRVFEAMSDPWFEAGSLRRNGLGEDWFFCKKAKDAGFQCYVDADLVMGHTTSMTIWPHQKDGVHGVRLELGEGHNVVIQHIVEVPA